MKEKPRTEDKPEDKRQKDRPYVGVQLTPEERAKVGRVAANEGRSIAGQLRWMIRQLPDAPV